MRISDWSSDVCSSDLIGAMNGCPTRSRRVSVPPMHRPLALSMRSSSATRHRRCLGTEKRFQSEVVQFSALFLPALPPFPRHPGLDPGFRFSTLLCGSPVLVRGDRYTVVLG